MIIREINISHDHAIGEPVTMLDYGLKLVLTGVELPPSYEVHFSNSLNQPATVAIGDASGVVVPYEYTEMSGTLYGWLYLHDSMLDGYTERSFAVKIIRRSVIDPPQVLPSQATIIEQAIVALNTAIERTEAARDAAEGSAGEAEESAQQAATAAAGAAGSESAAQGYAQQAEAAKTAAVTAAGQAQESATAAANSANAAGQSAATAQAAATRSENAMDAARASATSADESAGLAQTAMEESADNAQAAADSATAAAESATSAATSATNASTSANSAATSATAAGAAQTAAESAAGTATEKAAEAGQSAADAAESAAEAQAAATEAGQIVGDAAALALGAYATSSASGAVATVDDGAEGVPVKSLTAYIVPVQDGTGDPSPDNIRAIHGFTGMKIARTGKNLAKLEYVASSGANVKDRTDNAVTVYSLSEAASYRYARCKIHDAYSLAGKTVVVSVNAAQVVGDSNPRVSARLYTSDGTVIGSTLFEITGTAISRSVTLPASIERGAYLALNLYCNSNVAGASETRFSDIQLELGSTATAYEPYQGEVYPVTWGTEAGIVYGGYFNTVTGVLTVTHALSVVSSDDIRSGSTAYARAQIGAYGLVDRALEQVCNIAKAHPGTASGMPEGHFMVFDSEGFGAAQVAFCLAGCRGADGSKTRALNIAKMQELEAAGTPMTICYGLTTPVTYQLSPLEIKSLKGVNNIFADTGDVDATVRADPDLHLAALIAQVVALSQNG